MNKFMKYGVIIVAGIAGGYVIGKIVKTIKTRKNNKKKVNKKRKRNK